MSKMNALLVVALFLPCLAACESVHSPVCGEGATAGNNDVPPSFKVDMGANKGTFSFRYETRNAKDRVKVLYAGNELFDSGCVGETREVQLQFGPGRSSEIEVVMQPNCSGTPATSWQFEVGCPAPGLRPTGKLDNRLTEPSATERH